MSSWLDDLFGAASAPTAGAYLTVGAPSEALTAARALTVAAGQITSSDGGAGTTFAIGLATTAVTPGSYTAANVTVDAYGRITAAASGIPDATTTGQMIAWSGGWKAVSDLTLASGTTRTITASATLGLYLINSATDGSTYLYGGAVGDGGAGVRIAASEDTSSSGIRVLADNNATTQIGFFDATPVAQPTIARETLALQEVAEALHDLGLISLTGNYPA